MINTCLSILFATSLHLGLEGDYNSYHPHARCQKNELISGIYYNSEHRISSYIGIEHNNFELGLVTGYTHSNLIPMLRYKKNNWFIAPALESNGNKGIVIGLEFKISP